MRRFSVRRVAAAAAAAAKKVIEPTAGTDDGILQGQTTPAHLKPRGKQQTRSRHSGRGRDGGGRPAAGSASEGAKLQLVVGQSRGSTDLPPHVGHQQGCQHAAVLRACLLRPTAQDTAPLLQDTCKLSFDLSPSLRHMCTKTCTCGIFCTRGHTRRRQSRPRHKAYQRVALDSQMRDSNARQTCISALGYDITHISTPQWE